MRRPGFAKTPARPKPRPAQPQNEFPRGRTVSNNLYVRTESGRVEIVHLPPAAGASKPMGMAKRRSHRTARAPDYLGD